MESLTRLWKKCLTKPDACFVFSHLRVNDSIALLTAILTSTRKKCEVETCQGGEVSSQPSCMLL